MLLYKIVYLFSRNTQCLCLCLCLDACPYSKKKSQILIRFWRKSKINLKKSPKVCRSRTRTGPQCGTIVRGKKLSTSEILLLVINKLSRIEHGKVRTNTHAATHAHTHALDSLNFHPDFNHYIMNI